MKKILSIDGGGMYGVIPVEVCIAIEDKLQQRLKQTFDLLVGTSTGSLICSAALRGLKGANRPGMSAEEIIGSLSQQCRKNLWCRGEKPLTV
ncbi:MAG: patatin-like phospholipase family protein [Cyanobacteria bacterium P01_G01_bin.39]